MELEEEKLTLIGEPKVHIIKRDAEDKELAKTRNNISHLTGEQKKEMIENLKENALYVGSTSTTFFNYPNEKDIIIDQRGYVFEIMKGWHDSDDNILIEPVRVLSTDELEALKFFIKSTFIDKKINEDKVFDCGWGISGSIDGIKFDLKNPRKSQTKKFQDALEIILGRKYKINDRIFKFKCERIINAFKKRGGFKPNLPLKDNVFYGESNEIAKEDLSKMIDEVNEYYQENEEELKQHIIQK